jgi:hypothetical protein
MSKQLREQPSHLTDHARVPRHKIAPIGCRQRDDNTIVEKNLLDDSIGHTSVLAGQRLDGAEGSDCAEPG